MTFSWHLLIPLACSLFGIPNEVAMQVVAVGFVVADHDSAGNIFVTYAEKGGGVAVQSGKYDGLGFQDCVDAVAADLAAGQKVFLISPRRYGKSSLVRDVLRRLAGQRVLTVEVTVSTVRGARLPSESSFAWKVLTALTTSASPTLR